MARIDLKDKRVVWRDFFAPDLPPALRFEFDRTEYEEALAALPIAPGVQWSDEQE